MNCATAPTFEELSILISIAIPPIRYRQKIKFLLGTHIPAIWNIYFEEAEKGIPTTSTAPFFGSSLPEKTAERQPPIKKNCQDSYKNCW